MDCTRHACAIPHPATSPSRRPHRPGAAALASAGVAALLTLGAAPARAQYGDAYHKPNEMRLQEMARQRASQYSAPSPSRSSSPGVKLVIPYQVWTAEDSAERDARQRARAAEARRGQTSGSSGSSGSTPSAPAVCGEGCSETLRTPNGSIYTGQTRGGQPNGTGTMTLPTGDKYAGTWRDGQPSGTVRLTYAASGDVYEGGFDKGQFAGPGRMTFGNGMGHDAGTFVNSRLDGPGELLRIHGAVREVTRGTFKAGVPVGVHETLYTGSRMKRRVDDHDKPGASRLEWVSGMTFVGVIKNDKPVDGVLTYPNGDRFTGQYHANGSPRVGMLMRTNGLTQQGFFSDRAKRQGYVAMTFDDGGSTEAMHVDDERSGPVLYTRANGDVLTGTTTKPGFQVWGMRRPAGAVGDAARPAGLTADGQLVELPEADHDAARQTALDAAKVIEAERAKLRAMLGA